MTHEELIGKFWALSDQEYADFLVNANEGDIPLAKYVIHAHTDLGSPKDSVLTVKDYVATAKRMGVKAISVTDHGTMYAVQSLYEQCEKAGIKLLIGCEFYVCEDVEDTSRKKHTRLHLCGYAKDLEGYHTLARMVTESNTRILSINKDLNYPCISKKILETFMGPGTKGHGHVILTSACIGGVLTGISYANEDTKTNLAAAKAKAEKLQDIILRKERLIKTKEDFFERKKSYDKQSEASEDKVKKAELHRMAEDCKQMADLAKRELQKVQKEADAVTKIPGIYDATLKECLVRAQQECDLLMSELIPEDQIIPYFEKEALWYEQLAGHGNWFIELQYHGIPAEQKYMHHLARIAEQTGIPTVAANDAHMKNRADTDLRKVINGLRFNRYEGPQIGDEELYLKSDIELFRSLCKAVPPKQAYRAMKGREMIADACNVVLKKTPMYPKYKE